MGLTVRPIPDSGNETASNLLKIIRDTFADLEDQLNNRAQIYTSTNGKIPAGLSRDDVLVIAHKGKVQLLVKSAKGFNPMTAEMIGGLMSNGTKFLGKIEGTTNPSTDDFPEDGNWGFYKKTTPTVGRWLCFNDGGNLFKVALT